MPLSCKKAAQRTSYKIKTNWGLSNSLFESFCVAFLKKRPQSKARSLGRSSQRAKRSFTAFLFCQAFFFVPLSAKEKSGQWIKESIRITRGTPHLCGSPLPRRTLAFTLLWRSGRIRGFRPLRRATADRGGSDKPLKRLDRNFQTVRQIKI